MKKKLFPCPVSIPLWICAVLTLAVREPISAQDDVYTLEDCMRYAVEHSVDVNLQQLDMADDRIARRDAILAAFTPTISGSVHAYSNFGRTIDPETNTYLNTTSFNNSYSLQAGIDLFNGFEAVNNLRIARVAQAMGLSEKRREEDRVCLATLEAYCNAVYYTHLTRILDSQLVTARQNLYLVRRQEELGQKGRADVIQMEADLADKDYERITAYNQMQDAYMTLKDVMFFPAGDTLRIDTAVAERAWMGESLVGRASVDDILRTARETLSEVDIARAGLQKARYALKTAKWQTLPSLTLYGGWSTSYYTYPGQTGYVAQPFGRQFENNGGEYVQLSLSVPLFDRLGRLSDISRKKNDLRRFEWEYDRTLQQVEWEVCRAVQDCDGARTALLQAEQRRQVQAEAYRLNTRKFEKGLISPIEYKTASDSYLKAQVERMNALLQYYVKKRVVDYYGGIPYLERE